MTEIIKWSLSLIQFKFQFCFILCVTLVWPKSGKSNSWPLAYYGEMGEEYTLTTEMIYANLEIVSIGAL